MAPPVTFLYITSNAELQEVYESSRTRPETCRKCVAPWVSGVSRRLPVAEKMAIEQPSDDLDSVTTVTPFASFVTCTQKMTKQQVTRRYRDSVAL
jgi:hypothetical protein